MRVGVGTVPRGSARQELVVARARLYFLVACNCVPLSLSHARAFWTGGRTAALLLQAPGRGREADAEEVKVKLRSGRPLPLGREQGRS